MKHHRANKGQSGLLVVIVLVAIVLLAYFAVPSFKAWVDGILGKFGLSTNASVIGLTLYYSDGTSKYFEGSPSLIQQTILDKSSGLTVTKLGVDIFITVGYSGSLSSYSFTSPNFQWQILSTSNPGVSRYNGTLGAVSVTGASIANNTKTKVWSGTLTTSTIESVYGHTSGNYYQLALNLLSSSIKLTFSDGTSQTKTLSTASMRWDYQYVSSVAGPSFISASVSVGGTPS